MGVDTRNISLGEVIPQCNDCGVQLCWSIDEEEYLQYKPFWDDWQCRDCNENYKGAYERYKSEHKPYEWVRSVLNGL